MPKTKESIALIPTGEPEGNTRFHVLSQLLVFLGL